MEWVTRVKKHQAAHELGIHNNKALIRHFHLAETETRPFLFLFLFYLFYFYFRISATYRGPRIAMLK